MLNRPIYFRLVSSAASRGGPGKEKLEVDSGKQFVSGGSGEDSYFIHPLGLGVGDGVGGYFAESGLYSRRLMHFAANEMHDDLREGTTVDPVSIIHRANEQVGEIVGGTTACVVCLSEVDENTEAGDYFSDSDTPAPAPVPNPNCILKMANLGDSGCLVLRGVFPSATKDKRKRCRRTILPPVTAPRIVTQSQMGTFHFNAPKHLGWRDKPKSTTAHDSNTEEVSVEEGDVVILATDGVLDNMFDNEILEAATNYIRDALECQAMEHVSHGLNDDEAGSKRRHCDVEVVREEDDEAAVHWRTSESRWTGELGLGKGTDARQALVDGLARELCDKAYESSRDVFRRTPFSVESFHAGRYWNGGKTDDIAVVAAVVTSVASISLSVDIPEEGDVADADADAMPACSSPSSTSSEGSTSSGLSSVGCALMSLMMGSPKNSDHADVDLDQHVDLEAGECCPLSLLCNTAMMVVESDEGVLESLDSLDGLDALDELDSLSADLERLEKEQWPSLEEELDDLVSPSVPVPVSV